MITERPTPTPSVEAALDDLRRLGVGLLTGALPPDETAEVRARLWRAVDKSEERGVPTKGYRDVDPDFRNRRVFLLFNLDPVFADLAVRPLALRFVHATIGERFLISNFSANITGPGSGAMDLHADQGYVTPPWPSSPLAVNVAWLLDDFTEEVGATRYVPGSHLAGRCAEPGAAYETVPAEAPAGSLMIMDGRLWHQTGPNRTADQFRSGLFGYYVLPWLRPQVNWNIALDPDVAATTDADFLGLLGYTGGNGERLTGEPHRGPYGAPEPVPADILET